MARLLIVIFLSSLPAWGQCVSISDARQHMGKKTCIVAKVLKVTESENGAFLLHFCAEDAACPFVVRAFPVDLDYVGDVRQLEGKEIEITGKIQTWNHQAEILLRDADQLKNGLLRLPPIPKAYSAESRGNASPGKFSGNKTTKRSHAHPKEPSDELDQE